MFKQQIKKELEEKDKTINKLLKEREKPQIEFVAQ